MADSVAADLRSAIITGARILHRLGLFEDNSGHLSARVGTTSRFWMIGHLHDAGIDLGEVREEHLVLVDAETGAWEGDFEPPGEYFIHTAIYRHQPAARGIVHCHPTFPVALSVAGVPVLPVHHWGEVFYPQVPLMEEYRQIDTPERGEALATALGDANGIVLRAHGTVTVGRDMREAVVHTIVLDRCARLQHLAAQVGQTRPLPVGARRPLSPSRIAKVWDLYAKQIHRAGRESDNGCLG